MNNVFDGSSKETLRNTIEQWVRSVSMEKLVWEHSGKAYDIRKEKIEGLLESLYNYASKYWDYRKGAERWNVENDNRLKGLVQYISKLGLIDITTPRFKKYDYILILGGARMANYHRCMAAKHCISNFSGNPCAVVAISGNRSINQEVERSSLKLYCPSAKTEFDAICGGLEKTFQLDTFEERIRENENKNLSSYFIQYREMYEGIPIFSIAGASSNASRRANTIDGVKFFFREFSVKPKSKILMISSSIYTTYQLLSVALSLREKDVVFDCIGSEMVIDLKKQDSLNIPQYLQEIKATVDQIFKFKDVIW